MNVEEEKLKIDAQIEILKKILDGNLKITKQKLNDELRILITNRNLLDIDIEI
jgi:hypothetical protein